MDLEHIFNIHALRYIPYDLLPNFVFLPWEKNKKQMVPQPLPIATPIHC